MSHSTRCVLHASSHKVVRDLDNFVRARVATAMWVGGCERPKTPMWKVYTGVGME
jgi:hypothetical protein